MAQQVKALAVPPYDLGLVPETHVKVEGENWSHSAVLGPPRVNVS